jgi:ribonuclease III
MVDSNKSLSALQKLQEELGYVFKNGELINVALTHKSHFHENKEFFHNERLEFLGDSVLNLAVAEILMEQAPKADEGQLSKLRAQLVSESALAAMARRVFLGDALRLGKGEDQSGGRDRDSLRADAFEAVLAAVYGESGIQAVKSSLKRLMPFLESDQAEWKLRSSELIQRDAKSRLQEMLQAWGMGTPRYICVSENDNASEGPFTMALIVREIEVLRHEGPSKKEATQSMAQELLAMNPEPLLAWLRSQGLDDQKDVPPVPAETIRLETP